MMLERLDSTGGLRRMHIRPNYLGRGFHRSVASNDWRFPLDVVEEGDDYVIRASMPGVKPEDIQVTIEDGLLTIEGETDTESVNEDARYLVRERRAGKYQRSLRLTDAIDTEKAEPRYVDGILTITLPRVEAKKPKRLEIKVGN